MLGIEKTCANCKWEFEDMEGTHCRHCIHNAGENFEPKPEIKSTTEIRNKAIDEFAEELTQVYIFDRIARDELKYNEYCEKIKNVAEQIKLRSV